MTNAPQFDDRHVDPRRPFFLVFQVCNLDGTLDMGAETLAAYPTLDEAVAGAKGQVEEHGGEWYVYEARPLRRVQRGKVRVSPVEAKRKR